MQGDALSVCELVVVGHQYGGEGRFGRIGVYGEGLKVVTSRMGEGRLCTRVGSEGSGGLYVCTQR